VREERALALLVGGLGAAVVARSVVVPRRWHLPYNLAMGAFAVGVGRLGGLTAADMGCARRDVPAGLRVGGIAFAAVSSVVAVGAVAGLLDDPEADVGAGEMALRVLVVIPVGTVVVEELVFRGALQGFLDRLTSPGPAMAIGAGLFGLWHVPPIWGEGVGVVVGTVAATTVAGVGFTWLRRRSGSIVAPMLAHLATNSTTFALSWATTP
jgi:membrane protease YdiL (CAAX protease family)